MNEKLNGEKFTFELKELSYEDLVSLYNDILSFHTYLDDIYKKVTEEAKEEANVNAALAEDASKSSDEEAIE